MQDYSLISLPLFGILQYPTVITSIISKIQKFKPLHYADIAGGVKLNPAINTSNGCIETKKYTALLSTDSNLAATHNARNLFVFAAVFVAFRLL